MTAPVRTAVATDEPARCAFADCQAGSVILDRAPRVVGPGGTYHPGCWAARLQEPPFG